MAATPGLAVPGADAEAGRARQTEARPQGLITQEDDMAKRAKKTEGVTLQQEAKRRGRPPKAKGNGAHPAAGRKVAKTDNQRQVSEDAIRENFLQHRGVWNQLTAKQKVMDKQWKDAKAALKADGTRSSICKSPTP